MTFSREVQSLLERGRLVRTLGPQAPRQPVKYGKFADETSASPSAGETPALHKLALF